MYSNRRFTKFKIKSFILFILQRATLNEEEFAEFCVAVDGLVNELESNIERTKNDREANEYSPVKIEENHENVRMNNGYSGWRNYVLADSKDGAFD